MSRYLPVNLRHKHRPAPGQATPQNLSVIVLRVAAAVCWCAGFWLLCVALAGLVQFLRGAPGIRPLEPIGYAAVAIGAVLVGCRLWMLKRWACATTVVVAWLLCLANPWRPESYNGGQIDVTAAIAASLAGCVLFAVPLTVAWFIGRPKLRSGF